ncbi:MAG: hypothetical protein WA943_08560 [Parvibaculum sp.]|uniref:hypothetical protein n=1 Tax=Parvibaculum sp. TaxID=2024848 RepID=UPI003C7088A7
MPVAHLIRYKTAKPKDIQMQLRGYVERELDRNPPKGFISSRVLAGKDGKSVAFYTEWNDAEALDDTRDSAPWEACMDLNDIHADSHDEATYEIA